MMQLPREPIHRPSSTTLAAMEPIIGALEMGISTLLVVAGVLALGLTLVSYKTDPHGGVFGLIGALFLLPTGLGGLVAGRVLHSGAKWRWVWQVLPLAGFGVGQLLVLALVA